MARQEIINFIHEHHGRGYDDFSIKKYLMQYYPAYEIDEAFGIMNNNNNANNISSRQDSNYMQSHFDNTKSAETQVQKQHTGLEQYIIQQHEQGHDFESIRQFLLTRGYNPQTVNQAITNANPQKKSYLIALLIILVLVFIAGIVYFTLENPDIINGFMPTGTTSTRVHDTSGQTTTISITSTRLTASTDMPTTTHKTIVTSTKTTTTLPTVTTAMQFTPETAPLKDIIEHINTLALDNPGEAKEFCDRVNERYTDGCYQELAKATSEKQYCSYIINSRKSDNCYIYFATRLKDFQACEYIIDSTLKRSCNILKGAREENTFSVNVPDITLKTPNQVIDLNSYSTKQASWTVTGNENVLIDINEQGLAQIYSKQGYYGSEYVIFTACVEKCLSDNTKITIAKDGGLIIEDVEKQTIYEGGTIQINLSNFINIKEGVSWTVISPKLFTSINGNVLTITDSNSFIGLENISIDGCIVDDCFSSKILVEVKKGFNFIMTEQQIVIPKNMNYSLLVLNNYVDEIVAFTAKPTEHLTTAIGPDSNVTITPQKEWVGVENITFLACKEICKNQTINVRVVQ